MSASLLCFNMRREHMGDGHSGGVANAVANARALLERARSCGARVLHVFTPSHRESLRGAFPGLEPLRDEEVIALRHISAFDEPILSSIRGPYLLGSLFSRSGLATLLGAVERRAPLSLIADACWTPDEEPIDADQILSLARSGSAAGLALVRTAAIVGEEAENVVDIGAWLR